jgi:hypothetical protein
MSPKKAPEQWMETQYLQSQEVSKGQLCFHAWLCKHADLSTSQKKRNQPSTFGICTAQQFRLGITLQLRVRPQGAPQDHCVGSPQLLAHGKRSDTLIHHSFGIAVVAINPEACKLGRL